MPYGKYWRSRKNYKKRYYRFSRFNLYRKRSAKAQSTQIYKLNKKVNKMRRDLSPDIARVESTDAYYFNNNAGAAVHQMFHLTAPVVAKFDSDTNKINFRGGKLYGQIRYADTANTHADAEHNHSASVRFIVYQLKVERNNFSFAATELINYSSSGADYNLNTVRPLREGVGAFVDVVHDYTINLTDDAELKNFKFNLPSATFRRLSNSNNAFAGEYGLMVVTAGLKWDINFDQVISINQGVSLYYNDDQQ